MTDEVRTHYGDDTPLDARWYVVHTYSGYENKVKEDLEKTIENRNLQDLILEVKYPTEQVTELKEGSKKPKTVLRKVYPGYVMVKMVMNDNTWYIVRNTRGVTGFVGPGSKPIPLTDEEVTAMGVERMQLELDIKVGEHVRVVSDPFANFIGTVQAIDPETQRIRLMISLFGKETPIELDFVRGSKTLIFFKHRNPVCFSVLNQTDLHSGRKSGQLAPLAQQHGAARRITLRRSARTTLFLGGISKWQRRLQALSSCKSPQAKRPLHRP